MNFTRTPSDKCYNAAFIDETAHPFSDDPGGVFAVPQEIAVDVGHLPRDDDLVAVEVVGLLVAFALGIGVVVYLCQGFVAVLI